MRQPAGAAPGAARRFAVIRMRQRRELLNEIPGNLGAMIMKSLYTLRAIAAIGAFLIFV